MESRAGLIPNPDRYWNSTGSGVAHPAAAGVYGLTCWCNARRKRPSLHRGQSGHDPGTSYRLTLAHELGHRLIDDAPRRWVRKPPSFASAFLMPAASVRQDLGDHRHAISPRN